MVQESHSNISGTAAGEFRFFYVNPKAMQTAVKGVHLPSFLQGTVFFSSFTCVLTQHWSPRFVLRAGTLALSSLRFNFNPANRATALALVRI